MKIVPPMATALCQALTIAIAVAIALPPALAVMLTTILTFEVSICVTALRWVLFMGYIPHETKPVDPNHINPLKL